MLNLLAVAVLMKEIRAKGDISCGQLWREEPRLWVDEEVGAFPHAPHGNVDSFYDK
jgi:hypothetical protein